MKFELFHVKVTIDLHFTMSDQTFTPLSPFTEFWMGIFLRFCHALPGCPFPIVVVVDACSMLNVAFETSYTEIDTEHTSNCVACFPAILHYLYRLQYSLLQRK